jgi:hypothetical protein
MKIGKLDIKQGIGFLSSCIINLGMFGYAYQQNIKLRNHLNESSQDKLSCQITTADKPQESFLSIITRF